GNLDGLDRELCQLPAMAGASPVPRLALVTEDDQLGPLVLAGHARRYHGTLDHRVAIRDIPVVRCKQHLVEPHLCAFLSRELLDVDRLANPHLVLLAAGLNNCIHETAILTTRLDCAGPGAKKRARGYPSAHR